MAKSEFVYLNGSYVSARRACLSPFDRGLLLGDALFETLRIYRGVPFLWPEHFRRLTAGCRAIQLKVPYSRAQWADRIRGLLARNRLRDGSLRITLTRGEYRGSLAIDPTLPPTVFIFTRPFTGYPREYYDRGVGVLTSSVRKAESPGGEPAVKSTNYLLHIKAKREADREGCHEAVLLNTRGHLTECSTSSLFFLRGERLCTPSLDLGILSGITRSLVIRLTRRLGLAVEEGHYSAGLLRAAPEAFITSSLREIMPVVRYDGRDIGDGRVGKITEALSREYGNYLRRYCARAGAA